MSYFHETIWNGVPKFLRRIDTALKNIGINERIPYNAPIIQFSSWMGGDRDGIFLYSEANNDGYISHKSSLFLLNFLIFFVKSIYLDKDLKYLIPRFLIPHIFFFQFISSLNSIMFSFGYCFTSSGL